MIVNTLRITITALLGRKPSAAPEKSMWGLCEVLSEPKLE